MPPVTLIWILYCSPTAGHTQERDNFQIPIEESLAWRPQCGWKAVGVALKLHLESKHTVW